MNSVEKYLTPSTIAATLIAMRSGRKEIFIVCEGGKDIALYSQVFKISRSNFIACKGKDNLMKLFNLAPTKGLDSGTVFVRDRDHDKIFSIKRNDVDLLVSDLYDFEMTLLHIRLFRRIMQEYMIHKATDLNLIEAYKSVVGAAAWLGALKLYSISKGLGLDFDELKLTFIDAKNLQVDLEALIKKVFARSKVKLEDLSAVIKEVREFYSSVAGGHELASGKDVIHIMQIALARYYKCCDASECSPEVLERILRISATVDDFRQMTLFPILQKKIDECEYAWSGVSLS